MNILTQSPDEGIEWVPKPDQIDPEYYAELRQELTARSSLIRNLRTQLGLTQQQAADIIGVSQSFMSKIETSAEPRMSVMNRLVAAMGGQLEFVATFPDKPGISLSFGGQGKKPRRSTPPAPHGPS